MRKLLTLCFCIATLALNAQSRKKYDANFNPVKSNPRYLMSIEKQGDKWHREATYTPEGTPAIIGDYQDEKCTVPDGEIISYYTSGKLKSIQHYSNGQKNGLTKKYYINGKISDSANYVNGRRSGAGLGWDWDGLKTDSTYFDGQGNGTLTRWHPDGSISQVGKWTNDTTKVGIWTTYHDHGKVESVTEYNNGKEQGCKCYSETGKELETSLCIVKFAVLGNSEKDWRRFLEKNLNANTPVDHGSPEGLYTVYVRFTVDAEGNLTDFIPLTDNGFGMEEEVLRILKMSPKWTPVYRYGRYVKNYVKQPVSFMISSE